MSCIEPERFRLLDIYIYILIHLIMIIYIFIYILLYIIYLYIIYYYISYICSFLMTATVPERTSAAQYYTISHRK